MENLKHKIKIALERTNAAYVLYLEDKKYFQAKRIYKSNLELYKMLQEFIYDNTIKDIRAVFSFIFHLEDWFEQFKEHELKLGEKLNLNSKFVFESLNKSPKFPENFLNNI